MSDELSDGRACLWKGLAAGLVAGLVATAAKTVAEALYPPRIQGEPEPPEALGERSARRPRHNGDGVAASEAIHWGFGAAAGAVYGSIAEFYPAVTADDGAGFGLLLLALTHETALPALELGAPPDAQSEREQTSEASTHILFGVVAERVRRIVRTILD